MLFFLSQSWDWGNQIFNKYFYLIWGWNMAWFFFVWKSLVYKFHLFFCYLMIFSWINWLQWDSLIELETLFMCRTRIKSIKTATIVEIFRNNHEEFVWFLPLILFLLTFRNSYPFTRHPEPACNTYQPQWRPTKPSVLIPQSTCASH